MDPISAVAQAAGESLKNIGKVFDIFAMKTQANIDAYKYYEADKAYSQNKDIILYQQAAAKQTQTIFIVVAILAAIVLIAIFKK